MTLDVIQPPLATHAPAPIIIVGHPRSGTSLVAGALARCGAWVGPYHTSSDNPGGFYEEASLSHKVRRGLQGIGFDPLGVASLPPHDWPRERSDVAKFRLTRAEVVWHISQDGYNLDAGLPWLWKQCKLLLVRRLIMDWWPDAKWVCVTRGIDDIVNSCLDTPFMAQHTRRLRSVAERRRVWEQSVHQYWQRMTMLGVEGPDCREVWTPGVVGGNLAELRDCVEWCGLTWDEEAVRRWVNPDWWHGKADAA